MFAQFLDPYEFARIKRVLFAHVNAALCLDHSFFSLVQPHKLGRIMNEGRPSSSRAGNSNVNGLSKRFVEI